jgi:hypothetical protein
MSILEAMVPVLEPHLSSLFTRIEDLESKDDVLHMVETLDLQHTVL